MYVTMYICMYVCMSVCLCFCRGTCLFVPVMSCDRHVTVLLLVLFRCLPCYLMYNNFFIVSFINHLITVFCVVMATSVEL